MNDPAKFGLSWDEALFAALCAAIYMLIGHCGEAIDILP